MVDVVVLDGKALKSDCCNQVVSMLEGDILNTKEIFYFRCKGCGHPCHLKKNPIKTKMDRWELGK